MRNHDISTAWSTLPSHLIRHNSGIFRSVQEFIEFCHEFRPGRSFSKFWQKLSIRTLLNVLSLSTWDRSWGCIRVHEIDLTDRQATPLAQQSADLNRALAAQRPRCYPKAETIPPESRTYFDAFARSNPQFHKTLNSPFDGRGSRWVRPTTSDEISLLKQRSLTVARLRLF
jgi:hypothetical protein